MTVIHKCANGKSLIIIDEGGFAREIKNADILPCVVLLSCWKEFSADEDFQLIISLLDAGCKYFVCFGPFSEELHDFIDDMIIDGEYDLGIITTYHDDELEEVIDFFVNTTAPCNKDKEVLLAIIDKRSPREEVIQRLLSS